MSDNACKEAILELLGYLEQIELRNRALLRLLKARRVFTEQEFEAQLRQASDTVDVENRAIHARLDALFPEEPRNAA